MGKEYQVDLFVKTGEAMTGSKGLAESIGGKKTLSKRPDSGFGNGAKKGQENKSHEPRWKKWGNQGGEGFQ